MVNKDAVGQTGEPFDFAQASRNRNLDAMESVAREKGVTPEMLYKEGDAAWAALAKAARVGPKGKAYIPSETTKAQFRERFAPAETPAVMYGRPPLGKENLAASASGLEQSCIRPVGAVG